MQKNLGVEVIAMSNIFLMVDDSCFFEQLKNTISSTNNALSVFTSCGELLTKSNVQTPDVIVVDSLCHQAKLKDYFSELEVPPVYIYIAKSDSVHRKLSAIREGVDHFLCDPIEITRFLGPLNRAVAGSTNTAKILLVADETDLAVYNEQGLSSKGGMVVKT